MSHLAEVYAKDLGVKMGRPIFLPHYTPLTYAPKTYITLHNSGKIPAKNYSYWAEFVFLLKKYAPQFAVVQVGHGEQPIEGIDLFFNGTIKQSSFVIQNAACHIGVDSGPVHIASALNTPLIFSFIPIRAQKTRGLSGTQQARQSALRVTGAGDFCSAANDESPRTIDMIMPEEILSAASEILGFEIPEIKTLHFGKRCKEKYVEVIPALPPAGELAASVVRLDILQQYTAPEVWPTLEQNTFDYLAFSAPVIIARQLSIPFLNAVRGRIAKIIWVAENFDDPCYKHATTLGIPQEYLCSGDTREERFKNLELEITEYNEEGQIEENKEKLEEKLKTQNLQFKTNRTVLCGPQGYPGIHQWSSTNGIEKEYFWLDTDFYWVYSEK